MAKVRNNIIIKGLNGDLGRQLRVRTGKVSGRTNISAIIDWETKHEDSPAQQEHNLDFRKAASYGKKNQRNPIYIARARGEKGKERQPKNVAMADWFQPPRILEIDLRAWRGYPDQVIRVQAYDDVQVAQVRVEIRDESGAVVEAGEAILNTTQWWEYAVRGTMRGEHTVTVFASDLPGHVTQDSAGKRLPG